MGQDGDLWAVRICELHQRVDLGARDRDRARRLQPADGRDPRKPGEAAAGELLDTACNHHLLLGRRNLRAPAGNVGQGHLADLEPPLGNLELGLEQLAGGLPDVELLGSGDRGEELLSDLEHQVGRGAAALEPGDVAVEQGDVARPPVPEAVEQGLAEIGGPAPVVQRPDRECVTRGELNRLRGVVACPRSVELQPGHERRGRELDVGLGAADLAFGAADRLVGRERLERQLTQGRRRILSGCVRREGEHQEQAGGGTSRTMIVWHHAPPECGRAGDRRGRATVTRRGAPAVRRPEVEADEIGRPHVRIWPVAECTEARPRGLRMLTLPEGRARRRARPRMPR